MAKSKIVFSKRLRGWRFVLFNFALSLGNICVAFMGPSYLAIEPHAAGDLEGTFVSFLAWSQTNFMLAMALGFPIGRTLAERYGAYRVYIVSFLVFAVASYFCAVSPGYLEFLYSRILLGFSGGITFLIGQELILNECSPKTKILGVIGWGILSLIPFGIAPPVGGWLADEVNWRYIFYINGFLALIPAGLVGALLYDRGFHRIYHRFDFVGFLLYAAVMYGIQNILNLGNDFDWFESPFVRRILILTLIALPFLIIWIKDRRHPIIDLNLFRYRSFTVGMISILLGFFVAQGLISLMTVQLQTLMDYSSTLAGLEFLPIVILAIPTAIGMALFSKYVDPRLLACLSLLGFSAVCYWIGMYDQPGWYEQIFWPLFFMGFFLAALLGPLTVIILRGLSNLELLRAAEMLNMFRIALGGMGITSQGIILYRREFYHQLHLANHFGGRQYASYDVLEQFSNQLEKIGVASGAIAARAGRLIVQEANILAMADAYLIGSYALIGLAAFIWLVPSNKSSAPLVNQEELVEEEIGVADEAEIVNKTTN
ncbi:MFS transporter [Candidatus Nitrosacidococcus tergens]|uniref:Drug resistance transporter, EmrB/QacA subfamily n=1 Tax=Candidatus Nitrosacidococcus tergens TaxID=553981 RepID=A0A7G1QAG0_9GAMM|nr:MFS transporter [Candidatus Nitrosacidococcus tergens]CAB1276430.1 Drug resistance transporter, EmrB/QacA subfamily [Candidatus Nitrosacidococcus tergens]